MTLSLLTTEDKQLHLGVYRVEGSFQFNGSSDPTTVIGRGIASVAHTSTGVWTVTLDSELQKAQVLVLPGSSFGPNGEGFVRFSLVAPVPRLEEAIERMKLALK